MKKKSTLLKELGWDNMLIKHFMVEDSEYETIEESVLKYGVSDTNTMILTFNSESSGSNYIIKRSK